MTRFVIRRLFGSLAVLWAVVTLVFVMIQAAPGDPAQIYLGRDQSPEALAAVRADLGLDRPVLTQYWSYLTSLVQGDFGNSIFNDKPVTESLQERAGPTLELMLVTVLWSSLAAIALGVVAASRRGTWVDALARTGTIAGVSVPNFWLGLMLILIFGLYIPGILPAGGWVPFADDPVANLQHVLLPALVLGGSNLAIVTRVLRVSMLDSLSRDYVTFARAMGLRHRRVVWGVALPNAFIPTATAIGLAIGTLIGGSVITEVVFSIPGIGQLMVDAFRKQDYPVAIGATVFVATAFVLMSFIVDVLYAVLNPRIRELYSDRARTANA